MFENALHRDGAMDSDAADDDDGLADYEQMDLGMARTCDVIRGFVPRPRYAELVKAR